MNNGPLMIAVLPLPPLPSAEALIRLATVTLTQVVAMEI